MLNDQYNLRLGSLFPAVCFAGYIGIVASNSYICMEEGMRRFLMKLIIEYCSKDQRLLAAINAEWQ